MKFEFSRQIFRKTEMSSFIKIRPVGVEFFHADGQQTDGQTDMWKIIVAFRNFAKEPKNALL
jgi:hypothetical protein